MLRDQIARVRRLAGATVPILLLGPPDAGTRSAGIGDPERACGDGWLEPRALSELIPDWQAKGAPLEVPVTADRFQYLTAKRALTLPTPSTMCNHGNFIVSMGNVVQWLGAPAEQLGAET